MNRKAKRALEAASDWVAGAKDQDVGEEMRAALGVAGAAALGLLVGALTDVIGFEHTDQLLVRLVAQIKALQQ